MPTDSIFTQLKSQTLPLHQQLEARVDMLRRLTRRDWYANLLEAFYGFYVPVEAVLADVIGLDDIGFELSARRKVLWLAQDLGVLGRSANEVPLCKHLPKIDSVAAALGSCYVLEGATLGGQIIDRHLRQALNIEPTTGGAFFHSYGDQVGPMWNQFREVVTAFAQENDQQLAIIENAQETFRTLDAWLAKRLVPIDAKT